ncbi:uncharacterized protein LOC125680290 [Ostrea edulis]|uniref:uncharacterized protein LOC125680290 n=1 Tax=Ostrea edulis TaxID=37623 RepID=UPI0024AED4DD|nr:uncharacterized protein LOC125680290 [Ostrea edulis]
MLSGSTRHIGFTGNTVMAFSKQSFFVVVLSIFFLLVKSEWTTVRPLGDLEYKFDSITRTMEKMPEGGGMAWYSILMQAPNTASPINTDDRLTWRKVAEGPGQGISRFEAKLNNSLAREGYRLPKIWLSAGSDEFSFQMTERSPQGSQTKFKGNSCKFGVQQRPESGGRVSFKILLKNCDSVPYFYPSLQKDGQPWMGYLDYYTQTEEMTSDLDNIKFRTCSIDKAAIQNEGLTLKLDFIFSLYGEKFGEELLVGFMYRYNIIQI